MKIPKSPPAFEASMNELFRTNMDKAMEIFRYAKPIDETGRYLHWDQMRFREPPDGLTVEEWWLATKMARNGSAQTLPFKDNQDNDFTYNEPPRLKALMHFADTHAGGALGSTHTGLTADDGRRYLRQSLADEPFASSLIEGAITTREIAKKMIFEGRPPRTRDERMVINNFNGMEFIKSIQNEKLTTSHILELQRIMTEGTLDNPDGAGRIRTNEDQVAVVDDSTGEVMHTPPDAKSLPERLQKFCDFANTSDSDTTYFHPMMKAIVLHFMLAYDHPFVDGNGRTSRALFYWQALKSGYWLMEYTSISSVIARSHADYYRAFLYTETDRCDMTYFMLHQAQVIHEALQDIHSFADEKREELKEFQTIVDRNQVNPLNMRQVTLVQDFSLKRQQKVTIVDYMTINDISYLTARSDLEDLVKRKIAKKVKHGRTSVYEPTTSITKQITLPNDI